MRTLLTLFVVACALACGCSRAREYELRGQVLAVDRGRQEITIKHEDIRGFMPGMTMPFPVKNAQLLDGKEPGDFVTATLVVQDERGFLSAIVRTGHADLAAPAPSARAEILEAGQQVPDIQLVDDAGKTRALREWRGRVVAVTFTYTRCPLPDFCPRMDKHFKAVQDAILADPRERERTALLSISFDPDHDTPQVLAEHAARAGADPRVWRFATSDRAAVDAFAARFGVNILREPSNPADLTHNLRTAVIASDGTLVEIFSGTGWSPKELTAALRQAH